MVRRKLSLDCDWKFHLGELTRRTEKGHGEIYNLSKTGSCPGAPQGDFDASDWESVSIPHDWSIRQPFSEENVADWGYKPKGKAWYRKTFRLPLEYKENRLILSFEGIATHSTVYFNGAIVARSFSGYTPFEADVTDFAHFGEIPNVLAVFVDADVWEGWWYEGAGIYRHVWLNVLNAIHIDKDSLFVNPSETDREKGCWNVDFSMELLNESDAEQGINLQIELLLPETEYENEAGSPENPAQEWIETTEGQVLCSIEEKISCPVGSMKLSKSCDIINPLLWDIETPNVYRVRVKLSSAEKAAVLFDLVETVCGFRTVEMDAERGFLLNHRPVKLLGTCNHQDFGGLGVAVPDNLWEYRIEKLKEMGSNAYRCAHGMPADEFIAACDRMGMLVMDENRRYDSSEEGLKQLAMLVKRHRNHPSVIMYSIFNEEPLQGTLQGKRMAKRMCALIHSLAPNSLTTGAMHGGLLAEDNAVSEVDVCGINYQIWEYDSFHEKYPKIPVVATETTSTFGVRGCYETNAKTHEIASYDDDPSDWGNTVRDTWKAIMTRDFVAGGFMWTGFDYLGEPTPHVWPTVSSFFGMLDTCGFPKDGFYLTKAIWSKKPVCHVLPHWNFKGQEGRMIHVMSHTNCEEAELFVNGKSFGKKPVDLYIQAVWEVPYEPGTLELVGYQDGVVAAQDKKVTTKEVNGVQIRPWKDTIKGNGFDAMPVVITAVDCDGREVPDANFPTKIIVDGGRLLGACNGNPNCHEEYISERRSIFNGRCLAIVKPDDDAEQIQVTVESAYGSSSAVIAVESSKKTEMLPSVTEYYLMNWKVSKVFEQKPDVMMKMEAYDMNSWQDICVNRESGSPEQLEGKKGSYIIYQIKTQIPKQINGHLPTLYFHAIWGECEIYINGKLRGECSYEWPCDYSLELLEKESGTAEIRILVKSLNFNAGLNSMVVLR